MIKMKAIIKIGIHTRSAFWSTTGIFVKGCCGDLVHCGRYSSLPSSQSLTSLQISASSMHFLEDLHWNMFGPQQFTSSELSIQSYVPSQIKVAFMQSPLVHLKRPTPHFGQPISSEWSEHSELPSHLHWIGIHCFFPLSQDHSDSPHEAGDNSLVQVFPSRSKIRPEPSGQVQ